MPRTRQPTAPRPPRAATPGRRRTTAAAGPSRGRFWRRPTAIRKILAALVAALVVGGATHVAVNRPQPDAVAVVVSTEHLPVGAALGANQTAVRHAPAELVPADAVGADTDLQGAIVASVLGPGEILTEADLRAASVLHGRTETERSVFVPVPDRAVLAALSPGDAVDLHSPVDGAAVVAGLTVLSVDRGEPGGGMWLGARPEHVSAVAAALGADPAGGSLVVALRPLPPRG